MSIVTLRIEESLLNKINKKLGQHNQKRSDFIRDAIIARLEDLEDLEAFEETKNDRTYTLAEVRKHLDLAD